MAEPLTVLRELSALHRIAVVKMHSHASTDPLYPAYETLAEHLHEAMMTVAAGTDHDAVIGDLAALWLELADDCDRQPRMLFGAWAGKLAQTLIDRSTGDKDKTDDHQEWCEACQSGASWRCPEKGPTIVQKRAL